MSISYGTDAIISTRCSHFCTPQPRFRSRYSTVLSADVAMLAHFTYFSVEGMLRFISDTNQPSLPTPFYSVLVSISVFIALSTVFYSINSPDNSPFSHSVLPVLSLPYWFFQLYISFYESLLQP